MVAQSSQDEAGAPVKRRGRPKMAGARRASICVRFTDDEFDRLQAIATKSRKSLADIVRASAICVIKKSIQADSVAH